MQVNTMRILGIDPGFGRIGWGVIEGKNDRWQHVAHGCIETNPRASFVERLGEIDTELSHIFETYTPQRAAVEALFFNTNSTTGMQVAHARGVILLLLYRNGIVPEDMTPSQVKQYVTGYGKATKEQVQKLVSMHLGYGDHITQDDAADALAIAIAASMVRFS